MGQFPASPGASKAHDPSHRQRQPKLTLLLQLSPRGSHPWDSTSSSSLPPPTPPWISSFPPHYFSAFTPSPPSLPALVGMLCFSYKNPGKPDGVNYIRTDEEVREPGDGVSTGKMASPRKPGGSLGERFELCPAHEPLSVPPAVCSWGIRSAGLVAIPIHIWLHYRLK